MKIKIYAGEIIEPENVHGVIKPQFEAGVYFLGCTDSLFDNFRALCFQRSKRAVDDKAFAFFGQVYGFFPVRRENSISRSAVSREV
jgi:hypothetical protein